MPTVHRFNHPFVGPGAFIAALGLIASLPGIANAAPPKAAKSKPVVHAKPPHGDDGGMSKGTAQLAGGDGVFGVVYTMQKGENLQLLKAKYTVEPHNDYGGTMPMSTEKIFWLTFAVKNPHPDRDLDLGGVDFTLVDEDANNYTTGSGQSKLTKKGFEDVYISLKPGQGLGQDPSTNELSMAWVVPGNAKIVKIMVNDGRATIASEKVLRYNVAGYPSGSPKNIIAPLPKYAADPTDATGATALLVSPAVMGKYYPSGYFSVCADSVNVSTTETRKGSPPEDGKEFVILKIAAKNLYYHKAVSTFELGDEKVPTLRDADGQKYQPYGDKWKASKDEVMESVEVEPNEGVTFRWFFEVPKGAKLKSLTFPGGKYSHTYQLDLTGTP